MLSYFQEKKQGYHDMCSEMIWYDSIWFDDLMIWLWYDSIWFDLIWYDIIYWHLELASGIKTEASIQLPINSKMLYHLYAVCNMQCAGPDAVPLRFLRFCLMDAIFTMFTRAPSTEYWEETLWIKCSVLRRCYVQGQFGWIWRLQCVLVVVVVVLVLVTIKL